MRRKGGSLRRCIPAVAAVHSGDGCAIFTRFSEGEQPSKACNVTPLSCVVFHSPFGSSDEPRQCSVDQLSSSGDSAAGRWKGESHRSGAKNAGGEAGPLGCVGRTTRLF